MSQKIKKPRKWNLNGRIRNAIRRVFLFSPLRKRIKERVTLTPHTYKCEKCLNIVNSIDIDHINPVIRPEYGFEDWNTFMARLFCEENLLQALCSSCHTEKTNIEEALREKYGTGRHSKASRKANSDAQKGHHRLLGIPKSIQHKQSMSLSRKGKPQTEARKMVLSQIHENSKCPVIATCIATNVQKEYESIDKAANELNVEAGNISRVCRHVDNRTQENGWKFEYKEKSKQEGIERRMRKKLS